jgi:hypothetical protein
LEGLKYNMDTLGEKKEGGILKGCVVERIDESKAEPGTYVAVLDYKGRNMTLRAMSKQPELEALCASKAAADLEWHKDGKTWFFDRVLKVQENGLAVVVPSDKPVSAADPGVVVDLDVALAHSSFDQQAGFAKKITSIIENCKLYTTISGKKYVHVEGWEALGAMTNHCAVITSVREEAEFFEASAELRDGSGRVVSVGIARAYKQEKIKERIRWSEAYQVMSMAQTRAIGKAYRNQLAWIIRLAGYCPTPAEERTNGE